MAATRMFDRIESTVQRVLDERVSPADEVEWAVAVVPVIEDCEEHEGLGTSLSFYATLACPEVGSRIVAQVLIPMADCGPDTLESSLNEIWDRMLLSRMDTNLDGGFGES